MKNNQNCTSYREEYKRFRNSLNKENFKNMQLFFKNEFAINWNNPKKLWQLVNNLLGSKKTN